MQACCLTWGFMMAYKTYTVIDAVQISQGRLKLDKAQAERREPFLQKDGDGYIVLQSVWFKAGESFGYDGELPRAVQISLEEGTPSKSRGKKTAAGDKGKAEQGQADAGNADREKLELRQAEIAARLAEIEGELELAENEDAAAALLSEQATLRDEQESIAATLLAGE